MIRRVLAFALASFAMSSSAQAARHYVDIDATGANNGSSWADAYVDLQSALGLALSGDEIWVAEGTYRPTSGTDRLMSFILPSGVAVYGGFAGDETMLAQRDWESHFTLLSGDIGAIDQIADNSAHILRATGTGVGTAIDGLTVLRGHWSESLPEPRYGAGVLNDGGMLSIRNCTIRENDSWGPGAGIANVQGGALSIENCQVIANESSGNGGGLYNYASIATVQGSQFNNSSVGRGGSIANLFGAQCTIEDSSIFGRANGGYGGAIGCYESDLTLRRVYISGWANEEGGGIDHGGGSELILNDVVFEDCEANWGGGGLHVYTQKAQLTDVIFRHCSTLTYFGGGAIRGGATEMELTRVQFIGNGTPGHNDGGGAIARFGGAMTAVNCLFFDNGAYNAAGGAIYNGGGELRLINCSFFGNTAVQPWPETSFRGKGGAIYNTSAQPMILSNCSFWGDSADVGGNEIYNEGSATAVVLHSLIAGSGGSGAGWDATLGVDGGGNWDLDPLYTNPSGGDLTLQPNSVLINAGDLTLLPAGITLDLAKNARVVGPNVDVGAYEWQGSVAGRRLRMSDLKLLYGGRD